MNQAWLDQPMLYVTYTGHGNIQIPAMLLALLPKATRPYAAGALAAFAASGLVRLVFRDLVQRQRPSNFVWAKPLEPIFGDSSFPSGHSTTSFAIAFMVLWMLVGTRQVWAGWLLVVWATLVGFSRVYVGVHYPGDVLGAAALALVTSTALYLLWSKKGWIPGQAHSTV